MTTGLYTLLRAFSPGMSAFRGNASIGSGEDAENGLTKAILSSALESSGVLSSFPSEMSLPVNGEDSQVIVQYTLDSKLQEKMEKLFRSYSPDYGAFVAIDATSGRVLAMVSHIRDEESGNQENFALRATFPSASIFKVVTAAAAIAERNYSADTRIAFDGRNHTLYKSHVLKTRHNRWTREITLRDAFAKSVNTVFGKIGAFTLGAEQLRNYADRFGFNREIRADVPIQIGRAHIDDDPYSIAESASGFTRDTTMSPLHGALIAAAVVNDGVMMEPYLVDSVHSLDGTRIYSPKIKMSERVIDPETASEMRILMRATVKRGTSRRSFRGFFRKGLAKLDVGGKTGSLTGTDPKGKYDWFIGFADSGHRRIAFASLTVHEKYWRVKSAYLARRALETYFTDEARREERVALAPAYPRTL